MVGAGVGSGVGTGSVGNHVGRGVDGLVVGFGRLQSSPSLLICCQSSPSLLIVLL